MIVPKYWAESRIQDRINGSQVTLRRFGWSNTSVEDAQRHADERARDALHQMQLGEELPKREPKVSYNGADGVPIREEIVAVHGETIITRNSYGALCLNSPNAFFIDIDSSEFSPLSGCLLTVVGSTVALVLALDRVHLCLAIVIALFTAVGLGMLAVFYQRWRTGRSELTWEQRTLQFIRSYVAVRPDWLVRIYRTPAGLRLLVMHRLFDPHEDEVTKTFRDLRTDFLYVLMCQKQHCFRARVSPKPWRIGIQQHLKPRPGVWPIQPERMPERQAWIARYDEVSGGFASCRFLEEIGMGHPDPVVLQVRELHDRLSKSNEDLPLG